MKEYKEIPLTQGKVALVDAEDYEYSNQFKWYAMKHGNTYYAVRHIKKEDGKQTLICMHRVIMKTSKGMDTDHINGDGWDNRRDNLRICTRSQNKMNGNIHKDNTSGYKGVFWQKRDKKWMAQIQIDGKLKYLGLFITKEEAALAYNEAAKELFGEFARLNNINYKYPLSEVRL